VIHTDVGRQVARFALRDGRTMFLFIFADPGGAPVPSHDLGAQKRRIRERFAGDGWETPAILRALDDTQELYFDRVSQIRMDTWSRGRVALLGDAACAPSLLAGQGSALAMTGAYVLAGELMAAGGDHARAFRRYEELLFDLLRQKQAGAEKFAGAFAPKTRLGLLFRNQVAKALRVPLIADWAIGRDLRDPITLPDYPTKTPNA
jgi:2-polyprenyl-6-methoxyphenol hydroxylase-like FAD-dependent oxidoreductase